MADFRIRKWIIALILLVAINATGPPALGSTTNTAAAYDQANIVALNTATTALPQTMQAALTGNTLVPNIALTVNVNNRAAPTSDVALTTSRPVPEVTARDKPVISSGSSIAPGSDLKRFTEVTARSGPLAACG